MKSLDSLRRIARIPSLALRVVLRMVFATLFVAAAILILSNWRWATVVEMRLNVDRITFTLAPSDSDHHAILDSVAAQSIASARFQTVRFSPKTAYVANPTSYKVTEDRFPESAWLPLQIKSGSVVMVAGDRTLHPQLTLEADSLNQKTLKLNQLFAKTGSQVTLGIADDWKGDRASSVGQPNSFGPVRVENGIEVKIELDDPDSLEEVVAQEQIQMTSQHCRLDGAIWPSRLKQPQDGNLTYRLRLADGARVVTVNGNPDGLVLVLTIPNYETGNIFFKGGLKVTGLDFTRTASSVEGIGTSLTNGTDSYVSYPGYPKVDPVLLRAPEFIRLDAHDHYVINEIGLDPRYNGISLRLVGRPTELAAGSASQSKDLRLTALRILEQHPTVAAISAGIVWFIPILLSGRKLWSEIVQSVNSKSQLQTLKDDQDKQNPAS